ncbi:copper chaperone PCu(A)C [Ruegeria arenilitoris]|uniref:copper chaperone PCu(A)C n=1 Tax=Ruegeria arenilitoris TaxID=1173585 RepID=UPI001C9730CF|nr:copper chaperone PCu(A)C [Ruegeria arenilitoris]MBY6081899.1 copper chaperone PCu(A)C [Ruegeria arenilitoris]
MPFKSFLPAIFVAAIMSTAAHAESVISVEDAYARSSGANAKAGAAFMMIRNSGDTDDQLVAVKSDIAVRVELHTHKIDDNGVAKMMEVEEGFAIPAGEAHMLQRGGDHVMFMGLKQPFEQGATIPVTLVFEQAGEVVVEIPVDLERKDGHGHMKHSN